MLKEALSAAAIAATTTAMIPTASAASQDECAIWICLPGSFAPSECSGPKKAMKDRIKDKKPPLPPFSSCAKEDDRTGKMSYDYSFAAYVPTRQVCTDTFYYGDDNDCMNWKTVSSHWVKGTWCNYNENGTSDPEGCTRTGRFIDVKVDGEKVGNTYYW
ncbi:conjugal transfer protein TraL (plasmid) [Guyparkeria sp. 1SP6A2]|nr:conjugal transfer protein TraL [Guyparkeria sp. 1SP6A2]